MLLGTFMVQNPDTQSNFILADYNVAYLADQTGDEYGNANKPFRTVLIYGEPICFNQTKYFVCNGRST